MSRLKNARVSHLHRHVVPAATRLLLERAMQLTNLSRPLSEVCHIEMGQSPHGDSYNDDGNGLGLIGGPADLGLIYPAPKKWTSQPTKTCRSGDIIICVRATIGEPRWADGEYCLGRGVAGIRPLLDDLNSSFVFRFLQAHEDDLRAKGTGTTFKTISKVHLERLNIPIPDPIHQRSIAEFIDWLDGHDSQSFAINEAPELPQEYAEQRRIIGRIEALARRVEEALGLREKAVEEAEALLVSARSHVFEFEQSNPEIVRLEQIANVQLGKMLSPKSKVGDDPRPYLRNANVQWDRLDLSDVKRMDFDEREAKKFSLISGDILVCEGGVIGRAAIWNNEIEGCLYQKALHRVRCYPEKALPRYLLHGLFWGSAAGKFTELKTQTTIPHLPAIKLRQFEILNWPINEQHRIVTYLDCLQAKVAELKRLQAESQKELEALMPSVLAQAFAGEH